jgi:hypothetical protein
MSESESETTGTGIDDEQLPEDLQPGEDNPLAQAPEEDELPDDLDVLGGKDAETSGDEDGTDS